MGRTTQRQKAERVLGFLIGLRDARAVMALKEHGFGAADVDDGWALLRALAPVPLDAERSRDPADAMPALRAWHERWLTVARVSLARRWPELGAKIEAGTRGVGKTPEIGADALVALIDGLSGADGAEARALLARRGLDEAELAQGRALVAQVRGISRDEALGPDPAAIAAGEAALWAWYLEWTTLARRAITSRAVLKALGLATDEPATDPKEA